MIGRDYLRLAGRIADDLEEIEEVVERIGQAWDLFSDTGSHFYLESAAFNLHSFYVGVERTFLSIAQSVDGGGPEGSDWHRELLRQVSRPIERVRPKVISRDLAEELDEYRAFRHVVRNVYSFELKVNRLEPLVNNIEQVYCQFKSEVERFAEFIRSQC